MKFKKITGICKARKEMIIFEEEGREQWLGDGVGSYPLFGMPYFTEVGLQRTCDLTDTQWDKIMFRKKSFPEGYNFSDYDETESRCGTGDITVSYRGIEVTPVHTEEGIMFIDGKYLEPFSDMRERELYLRETPGGVKYFAVKLGMMIYGIIMPLIEMPSEFTKKLGRVYESLKVAEENE